MHAILRLFLYSEQQGLLNTVPTVISVTAYIVLHQGGVARGGVWQCWYLCGRRNGSHAKHTIQPRCWCVPFLCCTLHSTVFYSIPALPVMHLLGGEDEEESDEEGGGGGGGVKGDLSDIEFNLRSYLLR